MFSNLMCPESRGLQGGCVVVGLRTLGERWVSTAGSLRWFSTVADGEALGLCVFVLFFGF